MHPEISQPIPGAKGTVLAAGWTNSDTDDLRLFRRAELVRAGAPDWAAFLKQAQAAASAELARLAPEYIRDKNQVIECVALHSDRQTTAGAVLAPDFLKRFSHDLGSKLLLAIPNRFTIYVFPALASRYGAYGGRVIREYYATSWPVSRELFELSASGLRAVGTFENSEP